MKEGLASATRDLSELDSIRVLLEQTQAVEEAFRGAEAEVEVCFRGRG